MILFLIAFPGSARAGVEGANWSSGVRQAGGCSFPKMVTVRGPGLVRSADGQFSRGHRGWRGTRPAGAVIDLAAGRLASNSGFREKGPDERVHDSSKALPEGGTALAGLALLDSAHLCSFPIGFLRLESAD